jgi:hypothetical protein
MDARKWNDVAKGSAAQQDPIRTNMRFHI